MYTGLLHAHSTLRWVVLVLIALSGLKALVSFITKKEYEKQDDKLSLFTLIGTHTQVLIGFILYGVSPNVWLGNFGAAMKEPIPRYFTVEHGLMMLIAAVLITIGRSKTKKQEDSLAKHKTTAIFNLITLAIIVVSVFVMMPSA